jgi:hypothetical protein
MHRLWFKVWQQGQVANPPTLTSLPRKARITGNIATRRNRDQVLAEVYALAADAARARQVLEEARDLLPRG